MGRRLVSALVGIKATMAALEVVAAAGAVLAATVVASVVAAGVAMLVASVEVMVVGSMEKVATAVEDMVATLVVLAVAALVDTAALVPVQETVVSRITANLAAAMEMGLDTRDSTAAEPGASAATSAAEGQRTRTVAATTEAARRCLQPYAELLITGNGRNMSGPEITEICSYARCSIVSLWCYQPCFSSQRISFLMQSVEY